MIYPEYDSPIYMIMGDMEMQIEEHCVRAVQRAGFNVDAESLRQALENDFRRYSEAYRRGYENRDSEIVRCSECIYCEPLQLLAKQRCKILCRAVGDDWFCGDGKRKEGDTE